MIETAKCTECHKPLKGFTSRQRYHPGDCRRSARRKQQALYQKMLFKLDDPEAIRLALGEDEDENG